jgi:prepilin-type processing-associated H-X9-DG protein
MRTLMLLCAVLALMWVLPLPARSQAAAEARPVTFVDLLGGKTLPLSLKLKELDGEWRRFTTGSGGGMEQFYMMMAMREGAPFGGSAYYTRGRTITVGTETFLVAYRREQEPFNIQRLIMMGERGMEGPPQPEPLTAETTLQLSLLNLRTLGTILDITPFSLEAEVTVGKAQQDALLREKSANQLRQITIGILMFTQDNDETLPRMNNTTEAIAASNLGEDIWKHPATGEFYRVNAGIGGKALGEIEDPGVTVLCFEATPWPDGKRHVAFLDGHTEYLTEAEWAALKKRAGRP